MKRRTFLQIAAAALAAPVRGAAAITTKPGPPKLCINGYTFSEDPNPLRFILMPDGHEEPEMVFIEPDHYHREVAGYWTPNPAWQSASHELDPEYSPYPLPRTYLELMRRRAEGVPVITGDLLDVLQPMSDIPAWRAYYDEGCSPRAALLEDERNA